MEKKLSKKEQGLGLLIALMGAEMGRSVTAQYGVKGDSSPERILQNSDVRRLLDLDEK